MPIRWLIMCRLCLQRQGFDTYQIPVISGMSGMFPFETPGYTGYGRYKMYHKDRYIVSFLSSHVPTTQTVVTATPAWSDSRPLLRLSPGMGRPPCGIWIQTKQRVQNVPVDKKSDNVKNPSRKFFGNTLVRDIDVIRRQYPARSDRYCSQKKAKPNTSMILTQLVDDLLQGRIVLVHKQTRS